MIDFSDRIALFDYDATADLRVTEIGSTKHGHVTVQDITFAGIPDSELTPAYLVVPDGVGTFAGILWVHWLGEEHSNREQYLQEAIALAPRGAVSLLINAMWSAPHWYENRVSAEDYNNSIRQVIALRRAMDLLMSQPNVDSSRIGYVGHDYGAMYGTLMAGVDPRAKTYVFMAPTVSLYDWAFFAAQPDSKVDYIRKNAVFELTDYIRRVKNASLLFQFARHDVYVGYMKAREFFRAANEPKQFKMYDDAEHDMKSPQIAADRGDWLVRELGLEG